MITSLPSIAILIDCWETNKWNKEANTCFANIINVLDTSESITTVVLATYNCKTERFTTDSIWANNHKLLFSTPIRKKIHCLQDAYDYLYKHKDNKYQLEKTNSIIWNYKNSTKYQISMNWWWELEYYLLLHPEIKNIYFFGTAWNQCLRTRPLGYESVIEEAPHLNILTNSKCVLSEVHSEPTNIENDINWKSVGNDIYLYQPILSSI